LAAKYTMPARMWRHGIQRFLDSVAVCHLPVALDHI
jgi:hypothetical protein